MFRSLPFSFAMRTGFFLLLSDTDERLLIAPFWDDLDGSEPTAAASYQLTGTAPNRVLTMEWLNWKHFGFGSAGPKISFQVKLYETADVVEMLCRQGNRILDAFASVVALFLKPYNPAS